MHRISFHLNEKNTFTYRIELKRKLIIMRNAPNLRFKFVNIKYLCLICIYIAIELGSAFKRFLSALMFYFRFFTQIK